MVIVLRLLFVLILASMLGVTVWASLHTPLSELPRSVWGHPWFIAAMADAYWGFLTFYVWVAYKETGFVARALWLVAILLFGNIAMSVYCLRELFRVPNGAPLSSVLLRRTA